MKVLLVWRLMKKRKMWITNTANRLAECQSGLSAVLAAQEKTVDIEKLKSLDSDLSMAAQCLRHAWQTMKHNGMEATAKEIADTVLDVETAAEMVSETLAANG